MKIPLQEKIAELEARIEKLEKVRHTRPIKGALDLSQDKDWKVMWASFDALVKRIFGR